MAKPVRVLFLAGCILNICNSQLTPRSFDSDYRTPDYDKVLEVTKEYDSDSVTELFDERKKVAKRTAELTPSGLPVPSANEESSGPEGSLTSEGSSEPSGESLLSDSIIAQVYEQLRNFIELILRFLDIIVTLISDIEPIREKRDAFLKNPLDGIFDFFGQLGGGRLNDDDDDELEPKNEKQLGNFTELILGIFDIIVKLISDIEPIREKRDVFPKNGQLGESRLNDDDELDPKNEQERIETRTDITYQGATPWNPLETAESPEDSADSRTMPKSNFQAFDRNIIKIIDNVSNVMNTLGNFTNLLYGNIQSTQINQREKPNIRINAVDNVLENVGRKRRSVQFVEVENALLRQSSATLPDILPETPGKASNKLHLGNSQTSKDSPVNNGDLSEERDTSLEITRKRRGIVFDLISRLGYAIVEFVENLITGIYTGRGIIKTALKAILPSRRTRNVNAFGELFTWLRSQFNSSAIGGRFEEDLKILEDRISDRFKAFQDSFQ